MLTMFASNLQNLLDVANGRVVVTSQMSTCDAPFTPPKEPHSFRVFIMAFKGRSCFLTCVSTSLRKWVKLSIDSRASLWCSTIHTRSWSRTSVLNHLYQRFGNLPGHKLHLLSNYWVPSLTTGAAAANILVCIWVVFGCLQFPGCVQPTWLWLLSRNLTWHTSHTNDLHNLCRNLTILLGIDF